MVNFAIASIDERSGWGERRQVTVLSCELLSGLDADPEDLSNQLDRYRSDVATIVDRHGGRRIGDTSGSILAVWGCADQTNFQGRSATASCAVGSGAPAAAVAAALNLAKLQYRDATVRLALDAGIIIACRSPSGRTGADSNGSLVGRVLSDARTLGVQSCNNTVLVSDAVRQLTKDAFVFKPQALAVHPALWTTPQVWTVTACKSVPPPHDRRAPLLVGNTAQLAALDHLLAAVLTRTRQVAVVTGEAGIGKTTLFRHFRAKVMASEARWIEATCRPEYAHATLKPIRDLLRQALTPAEIAWLCHGASEPCTDRQTVPLIPDLDAADRQLLSRFFGADGHTHGLAATSQTWPNDRQQRLVNLLIEMLGHVIKRQPTILAFEDLHWADGETLDFLALLVERSVRWCKFAVVLVTRRGDHLPKRLMLRATIVPVNRLTDSEIMELLARQTFGHQSAASAPPPLKPDILQLIAQRSDGVPLFAEQLAALYMTTADSEQANAILAGPTSLNLTLAARLDALGDTRSLAQTAAVLGRDFDVGVLARMLQIAPDQLAAGLSALQASGLVMPVKDRSHVSHRFSHALVRDAAYASLLKQQRRQLHKRAADTIKVSFPALADASPEAMALHYTEAGDGPTAAHWWRLAAQRALGLSHLPVAVAHLRRGLALLDTADEHNRTATPGSGPSTQAEELAIRRLLGPCLTMLAGNGADAVIANYRRCLELTATSDPPFEVLWGLQGCHSVRGELTQSLDIGEKAIIVAEASAAANSTNGDERCLLAHRMQGLSRLQAGEIATAISHYRDVERRYDPVKHEAMRFRYASDQGALATAHWSWAEAVAGNFASSEHLAEQALARADQLEHPHTSAHVVSVLAARAQTLRQREVAAPLALTARTLSHAHGFTYWSAWSEIILGWHEGASDPETGISRIERAIQDYRRTGAGQALPYAMLLKAEVALSGGLTVLAARTADQGLILARAGGLYLYVGELLRVRAQALMQSVDYVGDPIDEAELALSEAITLSVRQGTRVFAMRAAVALLRHGEDGSLTVGRLPARPAAVQAHAVLRQLLTELAALTTRDNRRDSAEITEARSMIATAATALVH